MRESEGVKKKEAIPKTYLLGLPFSYESMLVGVFTLTHRWKTEARGC